MGIGRKFWLALAVLAAGPGVGAAAPVVVELYTSQGCSSCPPADEALAQLAAHDDVIALSLHVDYWDYMGWKDTFGDPAFSERQKAYARARGHMSVYTPQFIIQGRDIIVGNRPIEIMDRIEAHRDDPEPVDLRLRRLPGGEVEIVLSPRDGAPLGACDVQIAEFLPEATVRVQRGENAGRTIRYANVVRRWERVDTWPGTREKRLRVKLADDRPFAVIVQKKGYGPVVAAAVGR